MKTFKILTVITLIAIILVVPISADLQTEYQLNGFSPAFFHSQDDNYKAVYEYANYDTYDKHLLANQTYTVSQNVTLIIPSSSWAEMPYKFRAFFARDFMPFMEACCYENITYPEQGRYQDVIPTNEKYWIDKMIRFSCAEYTNIEVYQITSSDLGQQMVLDDGYYQPDQMWDNLLGNNLRDTNGTWITFTLYWDVPISPRFPNEVQNGEPGLDERWNDYMNAGIGFGGSVYFPFFGLDYSEAYCDLLLMPGPIIYNYKFPILHKGSTGEQTYPLYLTFDNMNVPAINALGGLGCYSASQTLFYNNAISWKPREELTAIGYTKRNATKLLDVPITNAIQFQNIADYALTYSVHYITDGSYITAKYDRDSSLGTEYHVFYKIHGYDAMPYFTVDEYGTKREYVPMQYEAQSWFDAYYFSCGSMIYYNKAGSYSFIEQSGTTNGELDISSLYLPIFAEWDDTDGWFAGLCNFFLSLFTFTLRNVLYNLVVFITCEAPLISNFTRPIFIGIYNSVDLLQQWIVPLFAISAVATAFIVTYFIIKLVRRFIWK